MVPKRLQVSRLAYWNQHTQRCPAPLGHKKPRVKRGEQAPVARQAAKPDTSFLLVCVDVSKF